MATENKQDEMKYRGLNKRAVTKESPRTFECSRQSLSRAEGQEGQLTFVVKAAEGSMSVGWKYAGHLHCHLDWTQSHSRNRSLGTSIRLFPERFKLWEDPA